VLAIDEDKKYHDGKVQGMINNNSGISIDFSDWSPTERWWTPGFEGALPFVPVKEPTIGLLVVAQVPNQDYWEQATVSAPGGSTEEWIVRFNDGTTATKANHDICSVCSPSAEHPQFDECASEPVGSCDSLVPGDKVLVAEKLGYLGCYVDVAHTGQRDLPYVLCQSGISATGECSAEDWMEMDSLTIEKCSLWCSSFKYFGVQCSKECRCGDTYGNHGKADEADCDNKCTGDDSETCGDHSRNSIYSTAATTWSSAQVLGLTVSNTLYFSGDDVAFASGAIGYVAQHKGLVKEVAPSPFTPLPALGTTVLAKQDGADGYSMGKVVGSDGANLSVLFEQGLNNVGKVKAADVRLLCYAFA